MQLTQKLVDSVKKRKKGMQRALAFIRRGKGRKEVLVSRRNQATLYEDGGDFFPALFSAIEQAQHSVCAEFYIIKPDRTGEAFAQALIDAAARGLRVSLIYDYFGCYETQSEYFARLSQAGVECLVFNAPAINKLHWLDFRNHRKLVVLDGASAFLGGLNIGDEYSGLGDGLEHWRDVGFRLDGPAADDLQRCFERTWRQESGETDKAWPLLPPPASKGRTEVLIINGTPRQSRSSILASFHLAVAGARESIDIITPYFVPGPRLLRSLLRAVKRGVKIRVLVPSINDAPFVSLASRAYLAPLAKAGVKIYERQEKMLHAKVMIVDHRWATLGSANFDLRSFHRNHELNVIVDDESFGAELRRVFDQDLAMSRQVLAAEYRKRRVGERLLTWMLSPLTRFL